MKRASELLVERLVDWGVEVIFGLPGDGIDGIMEALRRHQDRIRVVLAHHEEAAASTRVLATGSSGRPRGLAALAAASPTVGGPQRAARSAGLIRS